MVKNPDAADGNYSVANGKVDLKVEDKAHPTTPASTVTINNIASASDVEKLKAGFKVKAGTNEGAIKAGETLEFAAKDNAGVEYDPAARKLTVSVSKDPTFNSVTVGDVKINNTGINAGNKQITNVASGGNVTTNAANIGDINRIVTAKDKYVTGGTANYQTNGDGTAALTGTNNLTANITGLKNNYVTSGSVSNDGKTLTLERNDTGKVNVDLSKIFTEVAKEDYHLVANPEAGSQGKYKADSNGNMVLTVANEKGDKKQVTLTDIASKAQQNTNTTNITNINNTIAKGLNFGGDSGADINKKLGEKLEIKGGASADLTDDNIGVVSDGTKLNVKLKKDVNLGADGSLTVNGKTYVNKDGLNANGQKITNVANGTANSDAVNFGQLKDAVAAGKTILKDGKNTTVEGEGTVANPYKVNVNDDLVLGKKGADGKDGSIGVNGKDGSSVVIHGKDGISIKGKDGKDGVTLKAKDGANGTEGQIGLTGPAGKDGKSTHADIGVNAGPASLDPAKNLSATEMTRLYYVDEKGDHQVATMDDGMKFAGNTGLAIKKLNSTMTIRGTGTKADTEYDPSNIKTMVDADGNMIVGLDKNLKADSVGINGKDGRDGATIKGGDGKPGVDGTNITRLIIEEKNGKQHDIATLDDGMKYGGDTGAVIKKKLNGQVNVIGGISDESKLTTDDNIGVVSDGSNNLKARLAKDLKGLNSVTAGNVVMDTTGFYVKKMTRTPAGTVSLTADGLNNGGNKIANIAAGEADTDAVNVSQLKKAAASATTKVADGKNTTVTSETNADGSKTYHVNLNDDITLGTDPSKQISIKGTEGTIKAGQVTVNGTAGTVNGLTNKTWDPNHITSGQAATEDQLKVVSGQAGKHSSVTAGSNISVTTGTNANGGTDYKVSVVDTPTFKTVTTGNTVMSSSGLTIKNGPSITQTGVDAGGKRITNVAAGKADTDAVNVGQLKQIGGAINKVDNRINRVGAGAAALAALHPLDFDPDDKWDFTLGYGNYKDAHSLALGAFYRPNEENMVNAGLSMKLGQGNHVSTSKVAMAKEIKDLRAELENVKGALLKVADGRPLDSMDMDKMQLFPDVPENHWAYDYVATLAGNGVIVGYPDGQFGGDRMMTRYEMAALIYRAMQNGAAADDRMARALKEFEPELERIRVDTISKHKDGTPDIQRVRVIKGRG